MALVQWCCGLCSFFSACLRYLSLREFHVMVVESIAKKVRYEWVDAGEENT